MKNIIKSIRIVLVFVILLGIIYPLTMTLISNVLFPSQAQGSLIKQNGTVVGSGLIGQTFISGAWFHGRPSAASYDGLKSGGTNLALSNPQFTKNTEAAIDNFIKENPGVKRQDIPSDIITASASGLDPEISLSAAYEQAKRVAGANGLTEAEIKSIIDRDKEGKFLGIFGQDRVNVLKLNMDIMSIKKK